MNVYRYDYGSSAMSASRCAARSDELFCAVASGSASSDTVLKAVSEESSCFIGETESMIASAAGAVPAGDGTNSLSVFYADKLHARWASVGNTRVFYISGNEIELITSDNTEAYETLYPGSRSLNDLNFESGSDTLTKCLSPETTDDMPEIHERRLFTPCGFFMCNANLWKYFFAEELLADYLKSETAAQWTNNVLLRALKRIPEPVTAFSAVALLYNTD